MYSIIKERFLNYIDLPLSSEQKNILDELKLKHTSRVAEISEILAESVFGNDGAEYIELAKIIAVLHDIGRWGQFLEHNGFTDTKSDHGETGADIILQKDILNGLKESSKQVVLTAVREHNKKYAHIYDDFTQIFVNIVRDADRMDNLYIEVENYSSRDDSMKNILPFSDEHRLSPRIYESIMDGTLVDAKDRETKIDFKFCKMAWCYDIKTGKGIELIIKHKYLENIYSDIDNPDETMQAAYSKIRQYLDKFKI